MAPAFRAVPVAVQAAPEVSRAPLFESGPFSEMSWSAVGWLLSPLGAALGRPFSQLVADSSAMMFVLVFTFPVLLGLLLGTLSRAR